MAPLSLKVVLDEGAVTRTMKFESTMKVEEVLLVIKEKILTAQDGKVYGLFLTSADNELSGVWLEGHRDLEYYMLRDGDQLHYLPRIRNLRVRMLDGSEKTLQVDESKTIDELMVGICAKIGITNYDEYGLCHIPAEEEEENKAPATGTLTLKRAPQKERDAKLQQLSKKLKTDDNVAWLEGGRGLRELGVAAGQPLLLKRRLFFSDRNVDARDPVQLNLLYVQARDAILDGRHPVTEDKAGDCKVRWINIRDVNRRILKKSLTQPRSQNRMYKYELEMNFMKPYYKDIELPENDYEGEDRGMWEECNEMQELVEDSEDNEKPATKRKKGYKKRKKKTYEEEEEQSANVLNEPSNSSELDPGDPVDAFLLSIGATLKTFSPYHLNLAKSKIFAVVQEHDLQQIVQKSSDVKVSATENIYME